MPDHCSLKVRRSASEGLPEEEQHSQSADLEELSDSPEREELSDSPEQEELSDSPEQEEVSHAQEAGYAHSMCRNIKPCVCTYAHAKSLGGFQPAS